MTRRVTEIGAVLVLVCSIPPLAQAQNPDGQALFARYCAACHGAFGEGDGPVASAIESVPNLRTLAAREDGRFPREAVMRYIDGRDLPAAHGERLMPVWGTTFAEADGTQEGGDDRARALIDAITSFIESLQN